jgi:hypothetical protein
MDYRILFLLCENSVQNESMPVHTSRDTLYSFTPALTRHIYCISTWLNKLLLAFYIVRLELGLFSLIHLFHATVSEPALDNRFSTVRRCHPRSATSYDMQSAS